MDKAKRKAIIAGNWKMNKTASEAAVQMCIRDRLHLAGAQVFDEKDVCVALESSRRGFRYGGGAGRRGRGNEMCIRDRSSSRMTPSLSNWSMELLMRMM